FEIRSGAYYDSVVLMQLQRALAELPDVEDAGVVMGTLANLELLKGTGLLVDEVRAAKADDLVLVVKAKNKAAAEEALARVDELAAARRSREGAGQDFLPKSLETAHQMLPDSHWVLVSVPGRYAAGVSREALRLGKHVFLYSDNVSLEDELDLKQKGAEKGLLVMGPDCGTAIINGIGLGFANRVRRGSIGLVAASGTGLQQVSVRIHEYGGGLTHALGTGGRDLSSAVGGITARMALDLLDRDPDTRVIVLISKPPDAQTAESTLDYARNLSKPVVVNFIGYKTDQREIENLYFTSTFDDTAAAAVALEDEIKAPEEGDQFKLEQFSPDQRYLRGLYSGGTLAYEALLILKSFLPGVYSNVPIDKNFRLENSLTSREHTIIDLGEDEFTVGRLHPMMDNELRIQRLETEAADPETAVILLDVVLGYGSHPDPAGELAPAIEAARQNAAKKGRHLEVVVTLTGTDADPQDRDAQGSALEAAGARIFLSSEAAVRYAGRLLKALQNRDQAGKESEFSPVDLESLTSEFTAINVGLDSFTASLKTQEAEVVQVDWKPSAGGNADLAALLEKMKG
ncbi:MAG: acyl-CoA synthetase FdrA, partial [Anaerolineales bacterium]